MEGKQKTEENKEKKKERYEKPELEKKGSLKDITANGVSDS